MYVDTSVMVGSMVGTFLTLFGLITAVYLRLGNLESKVKGLDNTIQRESKSTREEIRSMTDALVSHDHSADGQPVFRVPPSHRSSSEPWVVTFCAESRLSVQSGLFAQSRERV